MKDLYSRLAIACAILLSVLLTGLGIVLGQFFPLFANDIALDLQRTILGLFNYHADNCIYYLSLNSNADDVAIRSSSR